MIQVSKRQMSSRKMKFGHKSVIKGRKFVKPCMCLNTEDFWASFLETNDDTEHIHAWKSEKKTNTNAAAESI